MISEKYTSRVTVLKYMAVPRAGTTKEFLKVDRLHKSMTTAVWMGIELRYVLSIPPLFILL